MRVGSNGEAVGNAIAGVMGREEVGAGVGRVCNAGGCNEVLRTKPGPPDC